ncbi:prepilin-type N-terminal cleavage/methylation domain-containing protein [Paenibacillus sp. HJL G12]|uniref:Prepilin-type N-terminal cleavage/methylation domain-containing protein n=1 Tax=Paenibacillus dendrobii TaxID=2691084 RepID=A0A7X3LIY5_9BACL|nr:prepilin-type N-terminal cleavage/methylation domain-containing protein [Paenibacillus dendrobii]
MFNTVSKQEKGFTLVEVLAAIVIFSIVSIVLTSYFANALSYSKSNQNKTVMINLARNALVFMQKQDYGKLHEFYHAEKFGEEHPVILGSSAEASPDLYSELFPNTDASALAAVLHPTINNVAYEINVEYEADLHQQMLGSSDQQKQKMSKNLIPVKVVIRGAAGPGGHATDSAVEGYITNEELR